MEIIIVLALALGAMWLMSSRTRKQQREAQQFRDNLEPGQEVMTGSGLFGVITEVDGDVITIESTPGVETRWLRAAIAKIATPPYAVPDVEDAEIEASDDVEDATDLEVPDDLSSLPETGENPEKKNPEK